MPLILAVLLAVFAIFSCQKTNLQNDAASPTQISSGGGSGSGSGSGGSGGGETGRGGGASNDCFPTVTNLIAGQTMTAGTISIKNDSTTIYVTYTTTNGWYLTKTHLYVGDSAHIPVTNSGNAVPGQFPYSSVNNNDTTFTYQIPISALGNNTCGFVVAHARVVQRDPSTGNIIQTQTGWGQGTPVTSTQSNWAMKTSYCLCSGL